jgi:hypothetical protein
MTVAARFVRQLAGTQDSLIEQEATANKRNIYTQLNFWQLPKT